MTAYARKTGVLYRLNQVSVQYTGNQRILDEVSFEICRGDFLTLIGPSGCGKSTLLRILAGLGKPTGGTVTREHSETNRETGFVFQQPALLPWRTALQNLRLPLQLGPEPRDKSDEQLVDLLVQVGLKKSDATKRPGELSGGMQMRLSLARALVKDPEVLLLDEPFAAIDDLLRMRLQDDLRRLHDERQLTTVLVTHNLQEAAYLSDRAIVLSAPPAHIVRVLELERPAVSNIERRTAAATMESGRKLMEAVLQT